MKRQKNEVNDISESEDNQDDLPSKSQRKRDALRAVELAKSLLALPQRKRDRFELSTEIADALNLGDTIRSNGARKRQLHYIGKLLRNSADYETYWQKQENSETKAVIDQGSESRELSADKQIRDRLLQDLAGTMNDLRTQYPNANTQLIRQLVNRFSKATEPDTQTKLLQSLATALAEGRLQ